MPNQLFIIFIFLLTTFSCEQKKPLDASASIQATKNSHINTGTSAAESSSEGKLILTAKVIGIVDGDTVDILYHDLPLRIRMEHIDAPEKRGSQPYGSKAKVMMSKLCFGQTIKLVTEGEFDMGGRLIAEIINEDGLNVNKEMVKQGYAWHFKKYSDDISYDVLEMEAKNKKRGLWRDKNPIAPWDFR